MKTPNSIRNPHIAGITLLEVIVIVFVLCVLILSTLPVYTRCGPDGRHSDSLSNAKQIALALRMYADEHDGKFPTTRVDGTPLVRGDSSSRAFEHFLVGGITSKKIFLNKSSAWCKDPAIDTTAADAAVLKPGQNDWNYVAGLTAKADPQWPLIATATKSATDLTYTDATKTKGGVWKGATVILGYPDGSARMLSGRDIDLTDKTRTFPKRPDTGANILIRTVDWLDESSFVLAPE